MEQNESPTLFATPFTDGQAFEGSSLDKTRLDQRVEKWKVELGLIEQPEFPPKTTKMSEGSIRYHDRSHILVQDYLGRTSYELQAFFQETSNPPVFEELLTYFFSKVTHRPSTDPVTFTSPPILCGDIFLMRHLGYIDNSSIFIQEMPRVSVEIDSIYRGLIGRSDFSKFIDTLIASTADCEDWDELVVIG